MPTLDQLWIPILLSAVLVFAASSLIHMVFKWHNSEYHGFANEDEVRAAIRKSNPAPGQYMIPYCMDPKDMGKPEMIAKFKEGPDGFISLVKPGAPSMGKPLVLWFILTLVIAIVTGYLAAHTVPVGAGFLAVARVVSLVTFVAYAGGSVSNAIWMGKTPSAALKECLDAFIYGLVTACAFGWLWPKG
jgi:hypothetical protein